jgi:hypothetical protein
MVTPMMSLSQPRYREQIGRHILVGLTVVCVLHRLSTAPLRVMEKESKNHSRPKK